MRSNQQGMITSGKKLVVLDMVLADRLLVALLECPGRFIRVGSGKHFRLFGNI